MTTASANDGGTWSGLNSSGTYHITNGQYYSSGGAYTYPTTTTVPYITVPNTGIVTTPGVISPFVQTSPMFPDLVYPASGPGKLTPVQLAQLMREHTFIEMEGSEYCLFCFALDQYKTRLDHIFVISEE